MLKIASFAELGRGNWTSCIEGIVEGLDWAPSHPKLSRRSCLRILAD